MSTLVIPGATPVPTVADNLVSFTLPLWTPDHEAWVRAIGGMFGEVETYVNEWVDSLGRVVVPGWSVLFDPDTCPSQGLDYLGQIAGERIPQGTPDDDKRVLIKTQPNKYRGTPGGIARGAQKALTGSRIVHIIPRTNADGTPDPSGDNFILYTYDYQTPDPNRVWQELLEVIPAGMRCHYQSIPGATWIDVEFDDTTGHNKTWQQIHDEYGTWGGVRGATPGGTVFTW